MKTNKSLAALVLAARMLGSTVGYTEKDFQRWKDKEGYCAAYYEGHAHRARWTLASFFKAAVFSEMQPMAIKQLALSARAGYLREIERKETV